MNYKNSRYYKVFFNGSKKQLKLLIHSILIFLVLPVLMVVLIMQSCSGNKKQQVVLENAQDSLSYFSGVFAATTLKMLDHHHFNTEAFHTAMDEVFHHQEHNLNKIEADNKIGVFFNKFRNMQNQANYKAGELFLKENAAREGISITESGLQYKIIRTGNGQHPDSNSVVLSHFIGKSIDGEIFADSHDDNLPDTIPLNAIWVLPGLQEAYMLMSKDAHFIFYLPSHLGFNAFPVAGSNIKPYSPVIFELELLEILPATINSN